MIELTFAVHRKKKEFETAPKLSPRATWADYKNMCASFEPVKTEVEIETGAQESCMSELKMKLSRCSTCWYVVFAFDMILTKFLCIICSCKGGLTRVSVQHALLHGPEKDCGSWFTFVDGITRTTLSVWRMGIVLAEFEPLCFAKS